MEVVMNCFVSRTNLCRLMSTLPSALWKSCTTSKKMMNQFIKFRDKGEYSHLITAEIDSILWLLLQTFDSINRMKLLFQQFNERMSVVSKNSLNFGMKKHKNFQKEQKTLGTIVGEKYVWNLESFETTWMLIIFFSKIQVVGPSNWKGNIWNGVFCFKYI